METKNNNDNEKTKENAEGQKDEISTHIFSLRTTANREDQVMDFVESNINKMKRQRLSDFTKRAKKLYKKYKDKGEGEKAIREAFREAEIPECIFREVVKGESVPLPEKQKELDIGVYSIIRPHGMRGYIFVEASKRSDAEQATYGIPYARGILPSEIGYHEIEHMLEQVKKEVNIQKNDICEIISGPFKREKAKVTRIDKAKEEVVVELLESAVPIPITVKIDAVKVIRRD